jgi:putative SOS response-associated peptidase YedK
MINARAESLATKPAYRKAFTARRCLIPADGFYEWKPVEEPSGASVTARAKTRKQPMFIHARDGEPLAFAGLWEAWRDPEAADNDPHAWLRTCVIITTQANELLRPIHDRMPVIVPEDDWAAWLGDAKDPAAPQRLLVPAPDALLDVYPVSTLVNHAANNGPELVTPASPTAG